MVRGTGREPTPEQCLPIIRDMRVAALGIGNALGRDSPRTNLDAGESRVYKVVCRWTRQAEEWTCPHGDATSAKSGLLPDRCFQLPLVAAQRRKSDASRHAHRASTHSERPPLFGYCFV